MLDVPFVTHLIQHHRLLVPFPPLVGVLRRPVHILPLDAAVGDPFLPMVVERTAVVDGAQVMIGIETDQYGSQILPVVDRLCRKLVVLIGQ